MASFPPFPPLSLPLFPSLSFHFPIHNVYWVPPMCQTLGEALCQLPLPFMVYNTLWPLTVFLVVISYHPHSYTHLGSRTLNWFMAAYTSLWYRGRNRDGSTGRVRTIRARLKRAVDEEKREGRTLELHRSRNNWTKILSSLWDLRSPEMIPSAKLLHKNYLIPYICWHI